MGQLGRCELHHTPPDMRLPPPPPGGCAGQLSAYDEGDTVQGLISLPPLRMTSLFAVVIALVVSGYLIIPNAISIGATDDGHPHVDMLAWFATATVLALMAFAQFLMKSRHQVQGQASVMADMGAIHANSAHIIEMAADAIVTIDAQFNVRTFNRAAEHIFGYSREEVLNAPLDSLLPEGSAQKHREYIKAFGEESDVSRWMGDRMEIRGRRKNGENFYAEASISKHATSEGIFYTVLLRDVSERIEAEKTLREKEDLATAAQQHLVEAINALSEGFVLFDANERLVLCNDVYKEIYSSHHADVLSTPGVTFEEIIRTGLERGAYPDAVGREEEWFVERLEQHRNPKGGHIRQLGDGRWILVNEQKTEDGGCVGTRTDITNLKFAENELLRHQDHLEALVQERTGELEEKSKKLKQALEAEKKYSAMQQEFVALVSHEFRTPLTIIDGTAQRILRRKNAMDEDEIADRTSKIRSAVTRMTNLIEKTLSASKIDAGKIEFTPERCAIKQFTREACLRQSEDAQTHDIRFDIEGLPDEIWCDPRLFDQMLTNLMTNAVKYSPENSRIDVKAWQQDNCIAVSVADRGLGIPKDEVPKLFQRFFRASTSKGIPGTGIGLSVVQHFAEMHGGNVTVESAEGEGSTFTILLPINGEVMTERRAAPRRVGGRREGDHD